MMKTIYILVALYLVIICNPVFSQTYGCNDPLAINYYEEATINDGSCYYQQTLFTPDQLYQLPDDMSETSGLIIFRDKLVSMNDSGGEPALYFMNKETGSIEQTIQISNATNVDWEELAQDASHIYIGDFGNNNGNRTDLKVYKVSKNDIPTSGNASVPADIINFSYSDQSSFGDSDFDCEACFIKDNHIVLFSKSWISGNTRVYHLPKYQGTYELDPVDYYDIDGLLTAADLNEQGSIAVLLGYKDYNPFLWILYDIQNESYFSGNKRRIDFQNMFARQTEGVCFNTEDEIFISAEAAGIYPATAFKMHMSQWISAPTAISEVVKETKSYRLFYDKQSGYLSIYSLSQDPQERVSVLHVYDIMGRRITADTLHKNQNFSKIYLGRLNPGIYMIRISTNRHTFASKIIID